MQTNGARISGRRPGPSDLSDGRGNLKGPSDPGRLFVLRANDFSIALVVCPFADNSRLVFARRDCV